MEGIRTLIREQSVAKTSVLTDLSISIITTALAIKGDFGRVSATSGSSAPKDEVTLKKWLNMPADVLKRLAGKVLLVLY